MKSCLHNFSTGKLTGLILSILEFPRGGKFLKKLWRYMGGSVTG